MNGDDLVRDGLDPGPGFKQLLDAVYDGQLEGRIASRDEGMELARRLFALGEEGSERS